MIEPRTSVVTIYGGDYLDRIRHLELEAEALEEAVDRAKKAEEDKPRLNDEIPDSVRLSEEHDRKVDERDALVAEADAKALHVRVQALRRSSWKALIAAHPPREGNKDDALSGANDDTLRDALLAFVNENDAADRTILEPTDIDLDRLADVDYDRLYLTAFALNRGVAQDPKAYRVSRLTQTNSTT